MMPSERKVTRKNAFELIRQFAKQYRRELGKVPGEIIIVGGGSIMLNYKFRDATQDFDVILKTVSGVRDVIRKFADENGLPLDWMNTDFMKTESYSARLSEVAQHFYTLNNGTLEIRTVTGVYLIAMKLRAHRKYRNDISDAIGILMEESEAGNSITFDDIQNAYRKLYDAAIPGELTEKVQQICSMEPEGLKTYYKTQNSAEQKINSKIVSYIGEGAEINVQNVDEVIAKIKEKLEESENL